MPGSEPYFLTCSRLKRKRSTSTLVNTDSTSVCWQSALCTLPAGPGNKQQTRDLRIGYFGSSTGGAAALVAAAELPQDIGAVVSRGGRPDLAGDALPKVQAPTLLIVGGNDDTVIELNEMARDQMRCEVKLEIIPDATHLFEEPGALEQVAKLASDWFSLHLGPK